MEKAPADRRILIYPRFDAYFYSSFIKGLYDLFPKKNIRYSKKGFPEFGPQCLLFRVENGKSDAKIFVSFEDTNELNPQGLSWCDVYAKTNLDPSKIRPEDKAKIFPVGPYFPIRFLEPPALFFRALRTSGACPLRFQDLRSHFANYWRQFVYRLPEDDFTPEPSTEGFVFAKESLWKRENKTNFLRACFMKAVKKQASITFEGGFHERQKKDFFDYPDLTSSKRYSNEEYLQNVKKSMFVFNTPSVLGALSWKLAESLALGKAIISTPLNRELPAPLVHGQHIHYVEETESSIEEGVAKLLGDSVYRKTLEKNAREYYLQYLKPSAMIQRLFEKAFK